MKNLFVMILFCCSILSINAQDFFKSTDTFLKENVRNGLVNYDAISQDPMALNDLVGMVADFQLESADKNTQLAFYLNAYNVLAIKNVVEHYPLTSPLDVKGFFDVINHQVAGKKLTLNQIENDVIRPTFGDARIHFALVCVAKGCPQLSTTAFTGENVQRLLEKLTSNAINNVNFIRIDENAVLASEIFKWYIDDFGGNKTSVLAYINRYSNHDLSGFTLDYYTYDWQLNKQ